MFYLLLNPRLCCYDGIFIESILTLSTFSLHPCSNQCRPECLFQHVGRRAPNSTQQWFGPKGRILILSSWLDVSVTSCDLHNLCCFPRGRRRKWRWVWDLGRVTLWALAEEARRGKAVGVFSGSVVSLVAQLVKNPPTRQETPVRFLGQEDPLEKG